MEDDAGTLVGVAPEAREPVVKKAECEGGFEMNGEKERGFWRFFSKVLRYKNHDCSQRPVQAPRL